MVPGSGTSLFTRVYAPEGSGPHPGVVIVHGSKNHTGDYYQEYAEHFAGCGFVAALYDKRGQGRSTGDLWTATFSDLAADALAVAEYLRSLPQVDGARVGMWGDSQAGWIILLADQHDGGLAFLISKSGPAVTPLEQTLHDIEHNYLRPAGTPEEVIADLLDWYPRVLEYLTRDRDEERWSRIDAVITRYRDTPWMKHDFDRYYLSLLKPPGAMPAIDAVPIDPSGRSFDLDPVPLLRKVSTPTLVVYGTGDSLVPAAMGIDVVAAIDNPNVRLEVYEGSDHGIRVERWPSWLRTPVHADGYMELLCDFIDNPGG